MIEEIKNKLNNCVTVKIIDGEEYFNCKQVDMILDKYDNKPDYKSAWNKLKQRARVRTIECGINDCVSCICLYEIKEIEDEYNLGGE